VSRVRRGTRGKRRSSIVDCLLLVVIRPKAYEASAEKAGSPAVSGSNLKETQGVSSAEETFSLPAIADDTIDLVIPPVKAESGPGQRLIGSF
jgi:hypothetical protein